MAMNDREDAVARALDLLPEDDPARSDPRLLRDPELAEEARLARETATDVWLAVSPLRAAPPAVLDEVMARIGVSRMPVRRRSAVKWLAVGGWAAALTLAAAWWLRGGTMERPAGERIVRIPAESSPSPVPVPPVRSGVPRVMESPGNSLREEAARLRAALAAERTGSGFRPQVISLRSPSAEPRDPEEDRDRLLSVLANALRTALEVRSGAPGDPASLVIERGWLPEGFVVPGDGVIRHRNFPERDWVDLGLLRSDEGSYYDPGSGLVWKPDDEGRGFVGRPATETDDLSVFRWSDESGFPSLVSNESQPEGFVIADPASGTSQLILDGLPTPPEGYGRWLVWTDLQGQVSEMSVRADLQGTSLIAMPFGISELGSFQLIERPLVPNGSIPTVILERTK